MNWLPWLQCMHNINKCVLDVFKQRSDNKVNKCVFAVEINIFTSPF